MNRILLQFGIIFISVASLAASPKTGTRIVYDATLRNGFTIHHIRHEIVGSNTRLYTNDSSYVEVPTAEITGISESEESVEVTRDLSSKPDINEVISAASDKHQIDADLIASVIRAESDFNVNARSSKGAQGLMQLMPDTASLLGVKDAYDPAANVDGGTQYLRELLVRYNGDVVKALAAYNAGPGRVAQYRGVPPYRETRAYVARIIREFNRKKLATLKTQKSSLSSSTNTPNKGD